MKILAVFANPRNSSTLRLGQEDKALKECIRRSKNRDSINLVVHHAATVQDLRRALLDDSYDVIHFSGHGTHSGLAFEDDAGFVHVPAMQALSDLLVDYVPPLKCVLMNACYSVGQGSFVSVNVPFTIGMEAAIFDTGSIVFAAAFYDALGAGKDIEFSFRQGVHAMRLDNRPDSALPRLLRKGESVVGEGTRAVPELRPIAAETGSSPLLVGIGLDVSGSMERSLDNRGTDGTSRLAAFTEALKAAVDRGKSLAAAVQQAEAPVRVFSYAFGLRTGNVADFFSLIQAAREVVDPAEIERMKVTFGDEIRRRYSGGGLGGLAEIARRSGFGGLVDVLTDEARRKGEAEVRDRILGVIQGRLARKLAGIGDTTLRLSEVAALFEERSNQITLAEALIFGNTPMCQALEIIGQRFQRELDAAATPKPFPVLLLVSDGGATDGDPEPAATAIRAGGPDSPLIVGCFITDHDIVATRTLYAEPQPDWPAPVLKMFRISSILPDNSPFIPYFVRNGWRVPPQARAFVQVNHSAVLGELVGVVFSPMESDLGLLPKGR